MNDFELEQLLQDFAKAHAEAFSALVVALAQQVDKDRLADALRVQLTSFSPDQSRASQMRYELLQSAFQAVRRPAPPEHGLWRSGGA